MPIFAAVNMPFRDMKKLKEYIEDSLIDSDGFWVRELTADELTAEPIHLNCTLIAVCVKGTSVFSIDARDYGMTEGSEAFILYDVLFSMRRTSPDFVVRMFIFSREISSRAFMRFDSIFFNSVYERPVYHHRSGDAGKTLAYFTILSDIHSDRHNRYRSLIAMNLLRGFSLDVYDKILRYTDAPESVPNSRREEFYSRFMDLVNSECRRRRDVTWYADRLCITPRYLAGITRSVSGDSPKELIDYVIVQEIKILLTFSEMPLQEIADRLSFPDQSYLGRFFRRQTGMSLSDYRRSLHDL